MARKRKAVYDISMSELRKMDKDRILDLVSGAAEELYRPFAKYRKDAWKLINKAKKILGEEVVEREIKKVEKEYHGT